MSSRETAEKPRTVASMPGMPMMRELFGRSERDFVVAVAARADSSLRRKAEAFRTNSALWRAEGLATRTSASGLVVRDVDGFGGADGGLAPLSRAVEDDAIDVGLEDARLLGIGREA